MARITSQGKCDTKVPYPNRASAVKALNVLRIRDKYWDKDLGVYRCNICSRYHLGHVKFPIEKLNKLFDEIKEEKLNQQRRKNET